MFLLLLGKGSIVDVEKMNDNCFTVWLDKSTNNHSRSILEHQLAGCVDCKHRFTSADACVDFITDLHEAHIVVIVSADTAPSTEDTVVSVLSTVPCVESMLLTHVVRDRAAVELIRFDRQISEQPRMIGLESEDRSFMFHVRKNRQDTSFMYVRLVRQIFCEMDSPVETMITFCRQKYRGNASYSKFIDELESNYEQRSAISWYSSDSFLYKILNEALRTLDMEVIVHLRRFIKDLHEELSQLREDSSTQRWSTLYRGVLIHKEKLIEFQQNEGCLLSANEFLSTTVERETALVYAGHLNSDSAFASILFEIKIPTDSSKATFAWVGNLSNYGLAEQEVLFSIGSIFRIGSVELLSGIDDVHCVHLSLTDDEDTELACLLAAFRAELSNPQGYENLIQLLIDMGQHKLAEQIALFYIKPLTDGPAASIFNTSLTYLREGYRNEAYKLCLGGFELERHTRSSDDPKLARTYGALAYYYSLNNQWDQALDSYQQYVKLEQKPQALASGYGSIGRIYEQMKDLSNACLYYKKALALRLQCLPPTHPELATSYLRVGSVMSDLGYYSDALDLLNKCLNIQHRSLPEYHRQMAETHALIGSALALKDQFLEAISHYDKAIAISERALGYDHPQTREYIKTRTFLSGMT